MPDTGRTTEERAAEYRRLRDQAERCAAASLHPDVRENYLVVARSWEKLALDAERWQQLLHR